MNKRTMFLNEIKKWTLLAEYPTMNEWQAEREVAGNTPLRKMETLCEAHPGCIDCPLEGTEACNDAGGEYSTIYSKYWNAYEYKVYSEAKVYAQDMVTALTELASEEGFIFTEESKE